MAEELVVLTELEQTAINNLRERLGRSWRCPARRARERDEAAIAAENGSPASVTATNFATASSTTQGFTYEPITQTPKIAREACMSVAGCTVRRNAFGMTKSMDGMYD